MLLVPLLAVGAAIAGGVAVILTAPRWMSYVRKGIATFQQKLDEANRGVDNTNTKEF
jgi:hypothetical protein